MTSNEYEKIQRDLSHLIEKNVMRNKNLTKREATYKQAVLACKSVLSKYNPNNKILEIKNDEPKIEEKCQNCEYYLSDYLSDYLECSNPDVPQGIASFCLPNNDRCEHFEPLDI